MVSRNSSFAILFICFAWLTSTVSAAESSAGGIGSAFEIGTDEHYEVMKAFLWARGFPLYSRVWNDQPPLHTVLLGLCFKAFGTQIIVARGLALAFGASLIWAFLTSVRQACGLLAALIGSLCLITAPEVFELSVSAMLEVPAIGTALWATRPLFKWYDDSKRGWLVLSGALFGAALQIKLTSAIVLPGLLAQILLGRPNVSWSPTTTVRTLVLWSGSAAATYSALVVLLGSVPLDVVWASHFSNQTLTHAARVPGGALLILLDHADAICATAAGLLIVMWRRHGRRLLFPLVWLCAVILIHSFHRPWWSYYYLHFAVPLAWISGYGIAELLNAAFIKNGFSQRPFKTTGALLSASCLLALLMTAGDRRLYATIASIRSAPRVVDSTLVAKMRSFAADTQWVYTHSTMHAFHAQLPVIPELAVLPRKRFWSNQISNQQIFALLQRYRPEQILVNEGMFTEMGEFVDANYTLVFEYSTYRLFISNSLLTKHTPSR